MGLHELTVDSGSPEHRSDHVSLDKPGRDFFDTVDPHLVRNIECQHGQPDVQRFETILEPSNRSIHFNTEPVDLR